MSQARLSAKRPVLTAAVFSALFTGIFILLSAFKSSAPVRFERFTTGFVGTLAALITTAIFVRLDRSSVRETGLRPDRRSGLKFLVGVAIGLSIVVTMFSLLAFFGKLRLVPAASFSFSSFLVWTLAFIPLAFMEELAFRAYPLVVLRREIGVWPSLLVSTILFSLYHIASGWSIPLSFLGPGIWGLVFGLVALRSGGIAMSTGLHYATNVVQAAIGMSGGFAPLWRLEPTAESPSSKITEILGLGLQLTLLLLVIAAIDLYRRRVAKTAANAR